MKTKAKHFQKNMIVLLIVFLALVSAFFYYCIYYVNQQIIDSIYQIKLVKQAVVILLCYLIVVLFGNIEDLLKSSVLKRIATKSCYVANKIRNEKTSRIKYSIRESDEFSKLRNELKGFDSVISDYYNSVYNICYVFFLSIVSIAYVYLLNKSLLFIILVFLILNIGVSRWNSSLTNGFWQKYMHTMKKANLFSSYLTKREFASERKVFDYYDFINNRFSEEFNTAKKENSKLGLTRLIAEMGREILSTVFIIIVFLFLLKLLNDGKVSLGVFFVIYSISKDLLNKEEMLLSSYYTMLMCKERMKSFSRYLNLPEDNYDFEKESESFVIDFKNVSFKYPKTDNNVINHINLSFNSKEKYAIVGENGCGKSTLVKLLLGLYMPTDGVITINGTDIAQISRYELNRMFSVVFQENYDYPLTVYETLFDESLDKESVNMVFDALDLSERINSLENNINTELNLSSEKSVRLSGGEKQKLAIARAILAKSKFIIMDEPNAALDPITEARLYERYDKMSNGRGMLMITHRLGAVRNIKNIIVIENGEIVGIGSHEELLQKCNHYATLYTTQRSLYVSE